MTEVYNKVTYTNPFPGLRSFELKDSYLFFGRDNQIRDLRDRLTNSRFLAIIGSSGSGKSSLVKAGLIPQLIENWLIASAFNTWQIAFFNPEATPIRNMARALHQAFSERDHTFAAHVSPDYVETLLLTDPEALMNWCKDANLLIIIDQFEELFRYHQAEDNREEVARFIDLMLDFTRRQEYPVYVVLTMRSDYLDDCTDYEGLTEAINKGYYLLPKMNQEEIRQAITTPINVMGARISPDLTDRLLKDLGSKSDQLPILQHALMRTWNYWLFNKKGDEPIEICDYEAIGTMQKAITVHAEEVYADLPGDKSRLIAEKLFKALLVLGSSNSSAIQPIPVRTLIELTGIDPDQLIDVLNRFRDPDVAFLTPSTTIQTELALIIDISHERIMVLWERLRTWVREETESAKFYKQISNSATLYHEGKSGLWTNPELQIGLKWLAENRPTQAWANRYDPYLERAINFLEYSRDQHDFAIQNKEDRQRKELKRARNFAIFLGIGALISLMFLIVSAVLRKQAQQSEEEALAEKRIALFERARAENQTREAVTQKKIAEQQEIIAEQQKGLTEEQRVIAVREQQTAEEKRQEAEVARQMAVSQKQRAEEARTEAEAQRLQAEGARKNALQQQNRAETAQKDAETQRSKAVTSQKFAEQQRSKAIARTIAIQSYQMNETGQDDLPALLALKAYTLNLRNGGQSDNPDIFNALAKATDARTVLRGHADVVRNVVMQPGGEQMVASSSDDGTVKVWSYAHPAKSPITLSTSKRNTDGVRSIVFSRDGKTIYGGSEKGMLYSWNPAQSDIPAVAVQAHNVPIQMLLFTLDHSQLISISNDGHIRIWQPIANGLAPLQDVMTKAPIYCVSLTKDGKYLICGSNNGRVLRYELASLRKEPSVYTRREFGNRVTALTFSPDGDRLITGTQAGFVYAWGFKNNEPETFGSLLSGRHTSTVNDLAFTPNGKLLASCSADWSIHIWDYSSLAQQQQPIVISDFDAWVMGICFSNDSKNLIACGADKTVRVRNVNTTDLYDELSKKVKRSLTDEEWTKYIGKDIPYEK
ncbi:hypothetical protein BH09BAC4_BH09BAC4_38950 [soil metagenome]